MQIFYTIFLSGLFIYGALVLSKLPIFKNLNYAKYNNNNFKFEICDEDTNLLSIKKLEFIPNPPEKGKLLTINVESNLNKTISYASQVFLSVKYMRMRLISKSYDLCSELDKLKNVNIKCPIKAGYKILSYSLEIPQEIPNGNYFIEVLSIDQDQQQVFCSRINLDLR